MKTTQIRKTYRGLNPEMLYDLMRDLMSKRGIEAVHASIQTYSVSSGATQSRVAVPLKASDGRTCGSLSILAAANSDTRMALELDDAVIAPDAVAELQSDIDFMLGSYEVKW